MMVGAAIVRVPAPGWKPEGYTPPVAAAEAHHHERRLRLRRAEDAAVLADLVGAVPQRDRRHRRARPGLGDEPGDVPGPRDRRRRGRLRRPDQPVQHGGRFFWASTSDYHRPQEHLFLLLRARHRALRPGARGPARSAAWRCSCSASWSSSACMAAASPPCRLICGTCSARAMSAPFTAWLLTAWSMAGIFGPVLVNYIRAVPDRSRRAEGAGLQRHHVHHGGPAGDRLPLQSASSRRCMTATT